MGSSVGPGWQRLANLDIRELNMMDLEERIKDGGKMSIPLIAFIMVPIAVLIAAPGILRMLMIKSIYLSLCSLYSLVVQP
ncbi:hypothetical protein OH492_29490 [Vibrio chagasii]|nr:hypothetical protein [Vibrio chagasii]